MSMPGILPPAAGTRTNAHPRARRPRVPPAGPWPPGGPSAPPGLRTALEQAEQHDPDRAADHRAIGDVERRPVVVAPVPLDEIDHVAVQLAVDHVAQRA